VRRKDKCVALPDLGVNVPAELRDPDAPVWHDQRAYHQFMTRHLWSLPPAERMGCLTSPANRRRHAASAWAQESGTALRSYGEGNQPHPDWSRLRSWGFASASNE
jgi:hypothetical protein